MKGKKKKKTLGNMFKKQPQSINTRCSTVSTNVVQNSSSSKNDLIFFKGRNLKNCPK